MKISLPLHSQSPDGEMVDALVSGASAERRVGSSPILGTTKGGKFVSFCCTILYYLSPKPNNLRLQQPHCGHLSAAAAGRVGGEDGVLGFLDSEGYHGATKLRVVKG